jgi:hypothetical protein
MMGAIPSAFVEFLEHLFAPAHLQIVFIQDFETRLRLAHIRRQQNS